MTQQSVRITVDLPSDEDERLFRLDAADAVVRLLAASPQREIGVSALADELSVARSTAWRAVKLLASAGVVSVRETPQRHYVSVNADRVEPVDPVATIPQPSFREPVRTFRDRVQTVIDGTDAVDRVVGVVVFGSVAQGTADRRSDVDVFVVVDGDRTTARRLVTDVASELDDRRFQPPRAGATYRDESTYREQSGHREQSGAGEPDRTQPTHGGTAITGASATAADQPIGHRYEFDPYVESVESAQRAGPKLAEVFETGVVIHETAELDAIRRAVLDESDAVEVADE